MSEQQHAELFAAWLEGQLTAEQQQQFEALCVTDAAFSARVQQANQLRVSAEEWQSEPVPSWAKAATFEQSYSLPWWQSPKLSVLSFACSVCAIFMVLGGFQVSVQDGQLSLGFKQGLTSTEVELLVQQRMDSYQENQQQLFAQYADALNAQQQQNGAQLTEYLLSSSRQERREDFAELIKFINEQRNEDQVYYARQLNDLQQEIYANNGIRSNIPSISTDASQSPNE
ncbi:hypothetical protein QTP81_14815 [Alteromonas sp. ASW11-36]|uniref:Anti-sigma factor n=1 Tax=Alteromonas arenosi TaxID=3055817 RepID=A0ABT7T238_9ALTE|nr:hypothetical protein [Alteromonas sp. ASW11-36]MDM7861872.1 hypothetical protein [Alteromonas sp. ASW11-36]